jgi:hypothetical protein
MGQRLDRFRAAAAECVEAAGKSTDVNAAATLLSMAQRWLELADEQLGRSELKALEGEQSKADVWPRPGVRLASTMPTGLLRLSLTHKLPQSRLGLRQYECATAYLA